MEKNLEKNSLYIHPKDLLFLQKNKWDEDGVPAWFI